MTRNDKPSTDIRLSKYDAYQASEIIGNHYEILRLIGTGNLGAVYLARDNQLNEKLVIKVFHPAISQSPTMINRIREKIKTIRQINSPGVVRLHSFGNDRDQYYLVMELVNGINLEDFLKKQALEVDQATEILVSLCDILGPVHQHNIIHGNLKPRNIIIQKSGSLKIIDFGFTSPEDISQFPGLFDIRYMAPEQLYPLDPTPAIDIYSLGIIYYQMLTGQLPFNASDASEVVMAHARVSPTPPSTINPAFPPELDILISKILHKEPQKRFKDMSEIKSVLTQTALICPRCREIFPAHLQCPHCHEFGNLVSDISRTLSTDQLQLKRHTDHDLLQKLTVRKKSLKGQLDLLHHDNCSYCGKSLPSGFPFCPKCGLEPPTGEGLEASYLLVYDYAVMKDRKTLTKLLKPLVSSREIPLDVKKKHFPAFLIHIKDQPERAGDLVKELTEQGAQVRRIDPSDLDERLRYNSWVLPGILGLVSISSFWVSAFLGVPLLFAALYLVFRNFNKLNLPQLDIFMKNSPGLFSAIIIDSAKQLSRRTQSNDFLKSAYESILFQSFKLLEMMQNDKETQQFFSEVISSINQLLFQAGRNVETILLLEKNFDPQREQELKKEMKYLEQRLKQQWSVEQTEEFRQKLGAARQSYDDWCQTTEKLIVHYTNLSEILTSLNKMTPRIAHILNEMLSYQTGGKIEEKVLIKEVLTELSALEESFRDLE